MGDIDSGIIAIGPIGGWGGSYWDEKGISNIVQIFISHHDNEIRSLQFQYAKNGTSIMSKRHGANYGHKFDVVKFKYPAEYLTHVSGHKGYHTGNLCSITFGTNQGEYGPFGEFFVSDKEFIFKLGEDRQFYGFHGLADVNSVISIGVYLKPTTTLDYYNDKDVKVTKEGESWE